VDVKLLKPADVIGDGAFGTIYRVKCQVGGKPPEDVALKEPKKNKEEDARVEAELLSMLRHPNVVELKFSLEDHGVTSAVAFELVQDGDLYHFIRDRYDSQHGLGIFAEVFGFQLFRGLAALHRVNVVHRDIKPENLLISGTTGQLKITDFGCAKQLSGQGPDAYTIGTKEFRAPELLLHRRRSTTAIDVWSAVVVMTEMIGGKPVFGEGPKSEEDQLLRIAAFLGPPYIRPRSTSAKIREMMESGHSKYHDKTFERFFERKPVRDRSSLLAFLKANLTYRASHRTRAINMLADDIFRVLFTRPAPNLPSGNPLSKNLFVFSNEEVKDMSAATFQIMAKRLSGQ